MELNFTIDEADIEPAADSLERLAALCAVMIETAKDIERKKAELDALQKNYNRLSMDDVPTLMREVKLSEVALEDGTRITMEPRISASISKERNLAAMNWLKENGYSGIIKTAVAIEFPKDQSEDAIELTRELMEEFEGVTMEEKVHPMTLKSFVAERLAAGDSIPMDLFGVHEITVAKITPPRR